MRSVVEYVWLGGASEFRSKVRVLHKRVTHLDDVPMWNYDGSSTGQATGDKSEITLKPCKLFNKGTFSNQYVLCETLDQEGNPLPNNHRRWANNIFERYKKEQPWYGIEQEYFIMERLTGGKWRPLGLPWGADEVQGQYYCSVGAQNAFGRKIAQKHLDMCLSYNMTISGMNAEVAPGQWEYQVGPCVGIESGDELLMSRYFLELVAEQEGYSICWDPKPVKGDWNGSGCHTNFSTAIMRCDIRTVTDDRESGKDKTGLDYINEAIAKLCKKHDEHMNVYGENNDERMTGDHETASFDTFSCGIGNRGCSVRIGNDTLRDECGYFEDRRPASNMNPYLVTGKLLETVMG